MARDAKGRVFEAMPVLAFIGLRLSRYIGNGVYDLLLEAGSGQCHKEVVLVLPQHPIIETKT